MASTTLVQRLTPYFYIAPAIGVACLFSFVSMGVSLWVSFQHYDAFAGGSQFVGLDNYRRALFAEDSYFWLAMRHTFVYVIMSVVGTLLSALPLALLCLRAHYGQALFRTLYFLPSITPGVVLALVFFHIFGNYGQLLDHSWSALPALALLGVWAGAGYNMVIFLAGLTEIPQLLYDAARVDGANQWQQFRHVTLPMLRNTLVFVTVMTIIGSFQVFTSVYIMTSGGPERSTEVIAYSIFLNAFSVAGQMGYASALAWLLFAVIFVFVFFQMRVFRSRRIYDE
ncbi:MAG: sugar ABC transporter permease [Gemmatimonadetes bacterium]|jgi:multiple sugar transport system permease protein|nr:sugar ABC transporter permease [Gemmatimonadota bacterium]MBT4612676.1 sugar ABC transporter permease [Gemmatimonadota bacterium]MBT5057111.1 sugar ABC transporter permease [Gemmatimonadota bacterium]MBT5142149.1 sugar ABC transporter permease [Gemmatimonadota bacterium]MBT5589266.1 sugar ABC transporter permease [Gemmatimonadota bacterium]